MFQSKTKYIILYNVTYVNLLIRYNIALHLALHTLNFSVIIIIVIFSFLFNLEPPSAPQNLTANLVDQSTVILSWSPPKYLGGRNDTVYRVSCEACSSSVTYVPAQENFNESKVIISGLNPITTYRFMVYAENGVSGYDSSQFVDITVTTESSGT